MNQMISIGWVILEDGKLGKTGRRFTKIYQTEKRASAAAKAAYKKEFVVKEVFIEENV